jgi:catechol 2,3-dioxygenase-like lactoylglutathione lyase family enzyme
MRAQPLIVCRDVNTSRLFYEHLLGCKGCHDDSESHHPSGEYDRLVDPRLHHSQWGTDGLILQLHAWDVGHHHGPMANPGQPIGNGVLLWFEVDDFDAVAARARELNARVIRDVHINPNAQHRELWIADPDGYTVVVASHDGDSP